MASRLNGRIAHCCSGGDGARFCIGQAASQCAGKEGEVASQRGSRRATLSTLALPTLPLAALTALTLATLPLAALAALLRLQVSLNFGIKVGNR